MTYSPKGLPGPTSFGRRVVVAVPPGTIANRALRREAERQERRARRTGLDALIASAKQNRRTK